MDKKEVFKNFITGSEILVVDKNPGSRSRLLKIVCDLGANRDMVHAASGLVEAAEILLQKKISLVLSDYMVIGGSGFDLFKLSREMQPENKDLCLVLVTSNMSQTAVAKAAEEEVDSFIIKPYTLKSIQENLISTIVSKVSPSDYILKIEEGKKFILSGDLDAATECLEEARIMHSKPALAMFYLGQVENMREYVDKAEDSFQDGLSHNSIHYKCLLGLYDLLLKEKKFTEAYEIVKKLSKYFPCNSDRLTQIVRLAVRTENFQDMQFYYEIFKSLDERTSTLTNYMGAGLFVSGKHFLKNSDLKSGLQCFDNIAVSCSDFTKFMRATITLLVEENLTSDALKYLSRFPAGAKDDEDYLVSNYLIASGEDTDPNNLVKKGLDIYNNNIRDINCMKILIRSMEQTGMKEELIKEYRTVLTQLWPDEEAA